MAAEVEAGGVGRRRTPPRPSHQDRDGRNPDVGLIAEHLKEIQNRSNLVPRRGGGKETRIKDKKAFDLDSVRMWLSAPADAGRQKLM